MEIPCNYDVIIAKSERLLSLVHFLANMPAQVKLVNACSFNFLHPFHFKRNLHKFMRCLTQTNMCKYVLGKGNIILHQTRRNSCFRELEVHFVLLQNDRSFT